MRKKNIDEPQAVAGNEYLRLVNLSQSLFRNIDERVHLTVPSESGFGEQWEGVSYSTFLAALSRLADRP
jgi:hypothetical protein